MAASVTSPLVECFLLVLATIRVHHALLLVLHWGGERRGQHLGVHVRLLALLGVALVLLLLRLLALGPLCHQGIQLAGLISHDLDHVRHHVVGHAVHPGQLQRHVRLDEVVAGVQAGRETLLVPVLDKTLEQLLRELPLATLSGRLHGVLVQLVVHAQLHALAPAQALLVDQRRDPPELHDLVLLNPRGQLKLVKVVVRLNRVSQALEVVLLDEEVVHGLVDGHEVRLLHGEQVGLDEGQVLPLPHHVHDPRVVDAGREDRQQVAQHHGVLLQVEADGLIKEVGVRDLHGDVLERDVLPGLGRVVHHHRRRVVVLVILNVEEGQRLPVHLLLANADESRDVDLVGEQLEVLHQLV
mmetsp:Transcript_9511/g.23660  ORF Transcript_9511/g.23660 Transcript_9511/m.23660 type:complete len:355 (-) Transcript_9511:2555-3619(-)